MDDATAPLDLPSRAFEPRVYGVGAWTDNLHFACDAVAALRPRVLVELGTDRGESYFAFCQAVAENGTGTRCFAVDTWRGDEHAGGYDETTWAEVSAHHAAHYRDFSTLLRMTFDEALPQFAPESIDVLHLDGLHTEAAVRHDVEAWLPKIAPGGILLMHDVAVRLRDFGVWRVWEEMRERGRSYTFSEGPGLGVWQKPPATRLREPLETLISSDAQRVAPLAEYYRNCARAMQVKIAQHWRDGSIRQTAAAHQTEIQVFYTRDGAHREEDSVRARVGHAHWRQVSLRLPENAGAAPLRIDFLSALTTIDVAAIRLHAGDDVIYAAEDAAAFREVAVSGDAERLAHPRYLRLRITGIDPQLYLPAVRGGGGNPPLEVRMRLRVSADAPPD